MDRAAFLRLQPDLIIEFYDWMGAEFPLAITGLPVALLLVSYFTSIALKDNGESILRYALRPFRGVGLGRMYVLWLGLSFAALYFFVISHSIICLVVEKIENG